VSTSAAIAPPRENIFVNLIFNIALPSLILAKASKPELLGPAGALVLALMFPLGYGAWDFAQRRQANFVSIIGFASVLITGGLGLTKVDTFWFAVKEAAVPSIIGFAVLISTRTSRPLVNQILYNPQLIDVARVEAALDARANREAFGRLLANSSYWLVGSFGLSAVLNFALARYLLKSPAGTEAFNSELATMNLLSWPVIVLPTMSITMFALWRLLKGIQALSGLDSEQIFRTQDEPSKS
jgi:hypothetical protein